MYNKILDRIGRHTHLFILGSASLLSSFGLLMLLRFNTSALNAFGPTAFLYINAIKSGLMVSTGLLIISFIAFLFIGMIEKIVGQLTQIWISLDNFKKSLFILLICASFAFATHAPNIMHGYFNMDDFEIIAANKAVPLGQSLLIEHSDHTIPLLMIEMRILNDTFGKNPVPYNAFVFIIFTSLLFFTYLIFRRLGISVKAFLVFLVLFGGATAWAEMLTGYYSVSTIPQVSLFFAIMMWSYLAWRQTTKLRYMAVFAAASVAAVTIDIPGVWTIPAIVLFMIALGFKTSGAPIKESLLRFLYKNKLPVSIISVVAVSFAAYLVISFLKLHPNTFLSAGAKLDLVTIVRNSISIFSSGLTLSIIAPKIVTLFAYPALRAHIGIFWPYIELTILIVSLLLSRLIFPRAHMGERRFTLFSLAVLLITIFMVAIGRPTEDTVPDYAFKHIGMSFYFYCVIIAVFAGICMRLKNTNTVKVILPILIVVLALQQAFSFQTVRLLEESKARQIAVENLDKNLISELKTMAGNGQTITIPNLDGPNIYEAMPGFTLADYVPFLDNSLNIKIIRNNGMFPDPTNTAVTVADLRSSTSNIFREALKTSSVLKSYYLLPAEMWYTATTTGGAATLLVPPPAGNIIVLQNSAIDPEEKHLLTFTLLTDDVSGNLKPSISFVGDFGLGKDVGLIRVDDYTAGKVIGGKRSYTITTDLLQIYGYALSKEVSHITLSIPQEKNAMVTSVSFK
jgi:hypothetical protein